MIKKKKKEEEEEDRRKISITWLNEKIMNLTSLNEDKAQRFYLNN